MSFCPYCYKTLSLKEKIKEELEIEPKFHKLTFNGKIMKDDESLESNEMYGGAKLNLSITDGPALAFSLPKSGWPGCQLIKLFLRLIFIIFSRLL